MDQPAPRRPGRTLLELFAWLGDALLYRVNLIPERQRLVFLKLLGQGLRPARPAGGIVNLAFAQPSELAAVTLAAGARIKAGALRDPGRDHAAAGRRRGLVQAAARRYRRARMEAVIAGLQKVHRIDGAAKGYLATALFEGGQAASGEGVDVFAQSADRALWLALMAPIAPRPEQQAATNTAARAALGGGDSGATAMLSVGVVPAIAAPALFEESASAPAWRCCGRW